MRVGASGLVCYVFTGAKVGLKPRLFVEGCAPVYLFRCLTPNNSTLQQFNRGRKAANNSTTQQPDQYTGGVCHHWPSWGSAWALAMTRRRNCRPCFVQTVTREGVSRLRPMRTVAVVV